MKLVIGLILTYNAHMLCNFSQFPVIFVIFMGKRYNSRVYHKTKIKNYSYPLNESEILNVNKTFRLFNDDVAA